MTKAISLKNLRKNKKGFTLVEIIVVLVIIAILAAIAVPTMLGFVDKAKESGAISEARAGYVSAQMIASQESAKGSSAADAAKAITKDAILSFTGNASKITDVVSVTVDANGAVETFIVKVHDGKDYYVTITKDSEATVSTTAPSPATSSTI